MGPPSPHLVPPGLLVVVVLMTFTFMSNVYTSGDFTYKPRLPASLGQQEDLKPGPAKLFPSGGHGLCKLPLSPSFFTP